MQWLNILRARLRALLRRDSVINDIEEEMLSHLEMETRTQVERGVKPEQARLVAINNFGSLSRLRDVAYDVRGGGTMEILLQDVRYALRSMKKSPGFCVIAVATLAMGIGVNTAMFSVLNTFLLRPLPYPKSDQLVRVFRTSPHSQSWPHSQGNFFDYREQNDVFEYMTAVSWISPNLSDPGEPAERLQGLTVSSDFFPALGVQPVLGRLPDSEEFNLTQGPNRVAMLSHRFWLRRFGGDPNAVGRTLRLNGEPAEIIGVMPDSFENPLLWGSIDLWMPLRFPPGLERARGNNWLQAFARLKPGVSIAQAQTAMSVIAEDFANRNLMTPGESLRLEPLQRSMSFDVQRKVLWFTFGLAGFVLLIACGNVANLQLVRTGARFREYAIRAALGARRGRLVVQSLVESLAVSLIGGGLSLLIAVSAAWFMSNRLFANLPGVKVPLDFTVFGFALLASVLTGLIFGTFPALVSSRVDVNRMLRENSRGSTAGRSHNRLRSWLIVGEVAFALVLLAGAGLFLRGLQRFAHFDPGWKVDGVLMAEIGTQGARYEKDVQVTAFINQLEERLKTIPGVENASISKTLPIYSFGSSGPFLVEGQPEPDPSRLPEIFREPVTPQYFETLGAQLLEGRTFTSADTVDHPRVIVINETTARTFWPGESAVEKRIGTDGPDHHWTQVVGVVRDIEFPGSLEKPYTTFQSFSPAAQTPYGGSWAIELRSSRPEALANDLKLAVADIDPEIPVFGIRTARRMVEQNLGSITLLGTLLGAFAVLGLSLAIIGIYGVTSYSIAQRTGEFGIRVALGARSGDVLWLVLSKGVRLIMLGAAIGFGGAYAVGQFLAAEIPLLPTHDPIALGVITFALVAASLAGCYVPSRRASRVDPMIALRHE